MPRGARSGWPFLAGFALVRLSGGGVMGARKKYVEGEIPNTRFSDVAGVDESREELADVVSFLRDGSDYERMGAKMPRGVLLEIEIIAAV